MLELLRAWHDDMPGTTLLVVGSPTAQANRIAVLETGVNTYLKKRSIVPELAARVRAALPLIPLILPTGNSVRSFMTFLYPAAHTSR